MVFFPFTDQLPGVYGPTSTVIEKHGDGYAIGWNPISFWHKDNEPWFTGDMRSLAKYLVSAYSESLTSNIVFKYGSYEGEDENTVGISVFLISFKPTTKCAIKSNCRFKEEDEIDEIAFLQRLAQELDKLKPLLVFA